jgi:uncharacterized protein (DUF924 family)
MNRAEPAWQLILDYWFGTEPDDAICARQQSPIWWSKSLEVDADIRDRFEPFLQVLINGGNRYWLQFAESRLSAIIVLDQFSRNIYRDSSIAFNADRLALNWSLSGIEAGMDKQLRPIERVFFYLPLQHAESRDMQRRSVVLYRHLLAQVPAPHRETFAGFLDYAERHATVIEQFGRFPHRNEVLGRVSTAEELEYLSQPDSGF